MRSHVQASAELLSRVTRLTAGHVREKKRVLEGAAGVCGYVFDYYMNANVE